jgi:hypothetical protein
MLTISMHREPTTQAQCINGWMWIEATDSAGNVAVIWLSPEQARQAVEAWGPAIEKAAAEAPQVDRQPAAAHGTGCAAIRVQRENPPPRPERPPQAGSFPSPSQDRRADPAQQERELT